MAAQIKQSHQLSQSLRITPQLQQAIKMLQLSRMELEAELRKEMQENPLLEEGLQLSEEDVKVHESAEEEAQVDMQDPREQDEFDWEKYLDSSQSSAHSFSDVETGESMNYENFISVGQSLQEHLIWQMQLSYTNDKERENIRLLVDSINSDGYLETSLDSIAESEKVEQDSLLKALECIQKMDPPGVGARNLEECLILQARHLEEDTTELVYLIKNHLKDLETNNYQKISKAMNLQIEEVAELCKVITSMNPRPGNTFSVPDTKYVLPDIYVHKVGDKYMVVMNDNGLPKLRISKLYRKLMNKKDIKNETRTYMKDKLRSALWLIKSLHQRQRTIYKVTESIVRHQGPFLDKGKEHIKPMVLRDVAKDIGMHESTVSRVTNGKYADTPQGLFELKSFFSTGLRTKDGDSMSSSSVKLKVANLIQNEDSKSPLSDQDIFNLLKKDGITIARRTVAKYRQMLKIPPSSKRKKYF